MEKNNKRRRLVFLFSVLLLVGLVVLLYFHAYFFRIFVDTFSEEPDQGHLYPVFYAEQYGLINGKGNLVLPIIYESVIISSGGKTATVKRNGSWYLVSKSTQNLYSLEEKKFAQGVDSLFELGDGLFSLVRVNQDNSSGYRAFLHDEKGIFRNECLARECDFTSVMNQGRLIFSDQSKKFGIADREGNVLLTPGEYDYIGPFSDEGLAVFRKADDPPINRYGYIDKEGHVVLDAHFRGAHPFSEGMASVSFDGKKWYHITPDGQKAFGQEKKFVTVGPFSCERASFKSEESGLFGYVDTMNKCIVSPKYISASMFRENRAWVEIDEDNDEKTVGCINPSGRTVFKLYRIKETIPFVGELALVFRQSSMEYVNKNGRTIWKSDLPNRKPKDIWRYSKR